MTLIAFLSVAAGPQEKPITARNVRAIPQFSNDGSPAGYAWGFAPPSIYEQMGLKDGDVLISINGKVVSSAGGVQQELFDLLNKAGKIVLEIRRDGKTMTLEHTNP